MKKNAKLKMQLETTSRQLLIAFLAIIIALGLSMIMIAAMGVSPVRAMSALISGALGSKNAIAETVVKMSPLIFTGLSYALASRCGLTNIGMEGQLYIGAACATVAGVYITGLPAVAHIMVCVVAAFLGGGIWGGIAGVLKVKFGASEIITTVMLNTIATNLIAYLVTGPMCEPPGLNAQSYPLADTARFPKIVPGTRAHLGIILALIFILLFYVFLWRSKKGYEVRVSGLNNRAAVYSGVNTNRNVVMIMCLAGGIAGLAGANEIMGLQGRLIANVSPGYGFDGIAVALIGANSPAGIFLGAMLFGIMRSGGNAMQMMTGVPTAIIKVMQAIVIIVIVASSVLVDYDFKRIFKGIKKSKEKEA